MSRALDREAVASAFARARPSRTGWWRTNCPLCVSKTGKVDKHQSLAIEAATGWYRCWKCGARGRVDGLDDIDDAEPIAPVDDAIEPPEGWESLEEGGSIAIAAARFMQRRGVRDEACEEARVGVCVRGQYRGRVVVPVLARDGRTWRGFVARTFRRDDQRRKYLYPAGMRRGELLYNERRLLASSPDPVLVVEGVFDALPLWPDAVACLGKPSRRQVELLVECGRPIAVCLDGDAWQEGAALAFRLRVDGVAAGSVRLPPGEDPGTTPPRWIRERARRCIVEDIDL